MHERECRGLLRGCELSLSVSDEKLEEEEDVVDEENEDDNEEVEGEEDVDEEEEEDDDDDVIEVLEVERLRWLCLRLDQ